MIVYLIIQCIYIYNINGVKNEYPIVTYKKPKSILCTGKIDGTVRHNYDRIANIDKENKDWFLVPCTILHEHNRQFFDIKILDQVYLMEDNKSRYVRLLAKWKNISL